MKPPILTRILFVCLLAATFSNPAHTAAAPFPEADPSVFDDFESRDLLKFSFQDIDRSNIRAFLAIHRPDTVEGLFCRAWMADSFGKYEEAVKLYDEAINDPRAWSQLKIVAALNGGNSASRAKLDDAKERSLRTIRMCFEEGRLDYLSNVDANGYTRETREQMAAKYPDLIREQKAAYLLGQSRFLNAEKEYDKVRALVDELWEMDFDEWKGDFALDSLLGYRMSDKVYPNMKPSERLTGGDFVTRLIYYQAGAMEEDDIFRRLTVANWAKACAEEVFALDKKHNSLGLAAIPLVSHPQAHGAIGLFPNGDALDLLFKMVHAPPHGTEMAKPGSTESMFTLEGFVSSTESGSILPDAGWEEARIQMLVALNRFDETGTHIENAGKYSFYPDERASVAFYTLARNVCAPMGEGFDQATRELENLLEKVTPRYRKTVCGFLGELAFASGDMPTARKWFEQMGEEPDVSTKYVEEKLDALGYIEKMQRAKERYVASNNLESDYLSQFGREGVSVSLNFDTGSATLPGNANTALSPIVNMLEKKDFQNLVFRVEGHTDNTGTDAINEPLSLRRAQSVSEFLVQSKNVDPSRIEVDGFGARRPTDSNLSEAGRSANRRAELNLMGDASRPSLVATGTMNNNFSAVSPDGRLMLSSNDDVWDTESWVRLYSVPLYWNSRGAVFSPDGKYLFVGFDKADLSIGVLIDARTGVLVDLIPVRGLRASLGYAAWSPDSRKIAFCTGAFVHAHNVETGKTMGTASLPKGLGWSVISAWVKGGTHIASALQSSSRWIYLIDAETFEIERMEVPNLGWLHHLASSFDAQYLYFSEDSGEVFEWNSLGSEKPSVPTMFRNAVANGTRFAAKEICVHPGNPRLVALGCMHSKNWGVADFKNRKIYSAKGDKVYINPRWGRDGRGLIVPGGWVANDRARNLGAAEETGIYLLDMSEGIDVSNAKLEFVQGASSQLEQVLAFEAQKLLVARTTEDISVWDVTTARQIHRWDDAASLLIGGTKSNLNVFLAVLEDENRKETRIVRYDLGDFTRTELVNLGNFDMTCIDIADDVFAVGGRPFMERNKGTEEVQILVHDLHSGKRVAEHTANTSNGPRRYQSLGYSAVRDLAISPSGGKVAYYNEWADGYIGMGTTISKQAEVWNWKGDGGVSVVSTGARDRIHDIGFVDDDTLRLLGSKYYESDWLYRIEDGEYLKLRPKSEREQRAANSPLKEAFADINLEIDFSTRGEITFARRDTNTVEVTVLKKNDDWIAYNGDGYFAASRAGTEKVFWRVGSRMLPLAALQERFEKPALLADSLNAIFQQRQVQGEEKGPPKVSPKLFTIPYEMELVSALTSETKSDTSTVKVRVKTLTDDAPEPIIIWKQNGQSVRVEGGGMSRVGAREFSAQHDFPLADGTNVIMAAIQFESAEVQPTTATIRKIVPASPAASSTALKTELWYFGVGVSEYEIEEQNLDFPHKDAVELGKALQQQEGQLYKKVHVKTLTNSEATVRNIKLELIRFLSQAGSQDVVMVFLAGHGALDPRTQELYLIAHDSDGQEPFTGLELRDFSEFLERSPPTQKAFFMMDICHAGALSFKARGGSGLTTEEAVKLLEDGTGAIVLASSTGREFSVEHESFRGGHGAFTAALLEGMEGRADSESGNGDGYVVVTELTGFVMNEVPKITNGIQHPMSPLLENTLDFPISRQ